MWVLGKYFIEDLRVNESMAEEGRTTMNAATADLLAVKLHKPGWPGLKPHIYLAR
jgi:hypothetical protein